MTTTATRNRSTAANGAHPMTCECDACAAHLARELAFWNADLDLRPTPRVAEDAQVPARRPAGGPHRATAAPARPVTANRYAGTCADCGQWVEANDGRIAREAGRWVVRHMQGQCPTQAPATAPVAPVTAPQAPEAPTGGLDLTGLVSARYAVPGGDTRLKVQIDVVTSGKWAGWVFVKDAAEYGQGRRYGSQRPGHTYRGEIEDALRRIVADPRAAAVAYTALVGRCSVCHRHLEAGVSVERGMGPVCYGRFGG